MENVCHVYNRSICEFIIFRNDNEFLRMAETMRYYQYEKPPIKFSRHVMGSDMPSPVRCGIGQGEKRVDVLAYCIMPTHIHFLLSELKENGISDFTHDTLSSYSHYFNTKYERKGPLWESRSKRAQIKTDEQLLHTTRYIHLNPTTAHLVKMPEDWLFSSYGEYIGLVPNDKKICTIKNSLLEINPDSYKKFVEERIDYQKELARLK